MAEPIDAPPAVLLLVFEVGGRTLGLPSDRVIEVVRAVAVTPLPKAPALVEGVINVRGALVPVLDVRARLGLSARPLAASDHFVLARSMGRDVALHVDQALCLRSVERSHVEPKERVGWGAEHLAGVALLPDGLIVIVDLDGFLTRAEAQELDSSVAAAFGGHEPMEWERAGRASGAGQRQA
jgi:purine-binding chemotaxis protein CheW